MLNFYQAEGKADTESATDSEAIDGGEIIFP